jgi:hypothetical protein
MLPSAILGGLKIRLPLLQQWQHFRHIQYVGHDPFLADGK